jgi:hypothetical protein
VIDPWRIPNHWYKSKVEDLKLRLPRGGDPTSASGRAIIARQSDRMEMAALRRELVGGRLLLSGATRKGRRGVVVGEAEVDDR